ncbi:uncharacterized protein LOC144175282 [Haemaphysalis longicornis]
MGEPCMTDTEQPSTSQVPATPEPQVITCAFEVPSTPTGSVTMGEPCMTDTEQPSTSQVPATPEPQVVTCAFEVPSTPTGSVTMGEPCMTDTEQPSTSQGEKDYTKAVQSAVDMLPMFPYAMTVVRNLNGRLTWCGV